MTHGLLNKPVFLIIFYKSSVNYVYIRIYTILILSQRYRDFISASMILVAKSSLRFHIFILLSILNFNQCSEGSTISSLCSMFSTYCISWHMLTYDSCVNISLTNILPTDLRPGIFFN